MTRRIGAQVALLAFALATIGGLYAGNTYTTVLTRAIVALLGGFAAGQIAAWSARLVLRDYFQKRKAGIDLEYVSREDSDPSEDESGSSSIPSAEAG